MPERSPSLGNNDTPDHRRRWLACRSLISCGFDLIGELLNQVLELISEHDLKGINLGVDFHIPRTVDIVDRAVLLVKCKRNLHDVLSGEADDQYLLDELEATIAEFGSRILDQLKQAKWEELSEEERKGFCKKLGLQARGVLAKLNSHRNEATQRMNQIVSSVAAKDVCKPNVVPATAKYSIVSIDLADYTSAVAAIHELFNDPELVYRYNANLLATFDIALRQCLLDPAEVPKDPTGDGALIFIPENEERSGERAVWFALTVLEDRGLPSAQAKFQEWRRGVRIGIATGMVHVAKLVDPNGRMLSFEAGGTPLIEAVRLQAACPDDGIMICEKTRLELSANHRSQFPESAKVQFTAKKIPMTGYHRVRPPGSGIGSGIRAL
jgi:class 3 adenylate cyclase